MIKIEIGALFRKKMRNFLKELKYIGYDVEYEEYKYFLYSNFLVKCDDKTKAIIDNSIEQFIEDIK